MEEGTNSPEERAQDPSVDAAASPADLAERAEAQAASEAATEAATDDATEAETPTLIPLDGRSPRAETCPFFRAAADDGTLGPPFEHAESANRCIAFGEPVPQSTRQQELVCLQEAHVNCPRYLRGSLGTVDPLAGPARVRPTFALPRATLIASGILVVSAIVSVGFVVARGGIDLPVAAVATASATPLPSPTDVALAPSPSPSPVVSPSPAPSPSPSPSPSLLPSPSPSPPPTSPSIAPSPTPAPSATPTSDRYRLLDPCPDRSDCWIYTTRSGDNLYSIARYFGHSLETLYDWNPGLEGSALKPGREIRMPPPTK